MTCVTSVTGVAPVATSTYEGAVTVSLVPAGIDAEYLVGMMSAVSSQAAVSGHIGWFNVKDDFGALGDGITDDTLAIQAAINAACTAFVPPTSTTARCGIVFFPPGSYLISQTLTIGSGVSSIGGVLLMGCGAQAAPIPPATQVPGSQIIAPELEGDSNDVFIVDVGEGGGVVFKDLSISRGEAQTSGSTFNFQRIENAFVVGVATQYDFNTFSFGPYETSRLFISANDFSNITNRFFTWMGMGGSVHIRDNAIAGNAASQEAGLNVVGSFDFGLDGGGCDPFFFRNNVISGFAGGIIFDNVTGTLEDFWIEANTVDLGEYAVFPFFQATAGAMSASDAATVHEGHISNNAISLGNSGGQAPNAIHLDASGGGAGTSPQVAGIHIIGNTIEGYPVPETASPGAGIHIANGASDMTIVANRTNFQANAIEIVGEVGVTDGITIVAFGANSPANGYNTGVGSENENGIVLQPGTLDSPAAATASPVAGGELAPGNYLVSVSYVTAGGQETLSSIDTLVMLASGNGTIAVESPTAPDVAVFYNVYVSAVNGDHATETRQNASPILIGMMFTLTALETGGASPPSASTAVMTIQNVTLTGCNLTGCSLHGLLVDGSLGGVITGVSAIANNLWGYSTPSDAVDVLPGAITNVNISSNPGYNPVGNVTPPTIAIGTFANPYQQPVRIAIVSPGSTITSVSITSASGGSMTTGLKPGPDGVMLQLGVGESIALSGSSIGSSSWKWFRS